MQTDNTTPTKKGGKASASPLELQKLAGVGPQIAARLARMHINTVDDLLFHLPHRYEDRTRLTEIGALLPNSSVVVVGEVELAQVAFGRRRSLLVRISDGTGSLLIRMFHFSRAQQLSFRRGAWVRCYGEARRGANGYEMIHPEYRIFTERPEGGLEQTLTPVYPTTEGINQTLWRKLSEQALSMALPKVKELLDPQVLPQSIRDSHSSISLAAALQTLHRPPPGADLQAMTSADGPAYQRLIFEELLAHHFSLRTVRQARETERAAPLQLDGTLEQRFLDQLGFTLTGAQQRVAAELSTDLASTRPAMRLVQGDVGSGKTVVAALAMMHVLASGQQAVMMAPTELLADQHFQTLRAWFEPLGIAVGWLASKTPARQKNMTLEALASGRLALAVGTHALIQEAVEYDDLALVVIDEQHRFGVDQRLALRNKTRTGTVPHQMVMTATPIPRTLAMSFYADLDVSNIDELPPGRQPVETVVMPAESKRQEVIERVRVACQQGRQVYWVCPIIDESEVLDAQAATESEQELKQRLAELRIGLVHGRMKPREKEAAMTAFRDGDTDVLVATTVIEVGVDVPNASLMIIENAERMGLAQLHQLRGRVGRGSEKSYCILLYQMPLGQHAKERLKTLRESNDGFEIAEKDLAMRGAGELLGTRQTGSLSFRIADIIRDQALLPELPTCAKLMLEYQPDNIEPLIERWIGDREAYVNA